eukprot:362388-Chlamydomonas_euryale.AAC.9
MRTHAVPAASFAPAPSRPPEPRLPHASADARNVAASGAVGAATRCVALPPTSLLARPSRTKQRW